MFCMNMFYGEMFPTSYCVLQGFASHDVVLPGLQAPILASMRCELTRNFKILIKPTKLLELEVVNNGNGSI